MSDGAARGLAPRGDGPRWAARAEGLIADRRLLVAAVVFVVALAPRVWIALSVAHEPIWDGQYYHAGAQRIAAGLGYSDASGPWSHYPVGYSGFLALFYWMLGPNPLVGAMAGALVGAATAVAVTALARHALSDVRSVAAGLLVAFHPGLILQAGLLMSEPLSALGLVLAPLVLLRLRERFLIGALSAGAVMGLTVLVRPQSIVALPALGLVALEVAGAASALRRGLFVVGVACCATVAVVAPWSARNCAVLDSCALVSTNGGWNAAIGASARATGRFEELVGRDGCGAIAGPAAMDRCWSERARAWIEADPGRWAGLVPRKLGYTFDRQTFAVGYLAQADPRGWSEGRARNAMIGVSVVQAILLALAALGAADAVMRGRLRWAARAACGALTVVAIVAGAAWPLALIVAGAGAAALGRPGARVLGWVGWTVAAVVVVHAMFFGEDRYQVVVAPLVCLLACACFRGGDARGALVPSGP